MTSLTLLSSLHLPDWTWWTPGILYIPVLGTNIEYRLYSLSYGESLRTNTKASSAALEASPRAPMPCKVLGVLKKDGDIIEVGEVGIVAESIKMEMNVLANQRYI